MNDGRKPLSPSSSSSSSVATEDLRQLVRSLDDLDAEYAAGDLSEDDYRTLRNDYAIRVADAVRAAEPDPVPSPAPPDPVDAPDARDRVDPPRGRRLIVVGALLVFAIGAGWLLARSAGERGVGDALTGNIDVSSRQKVADCQQMGMSGGQLLEGIQCFDEVLVTDPENVDALTYRAWFLVLASGAGADVGVEQETELLDAAVVYLDQAIEIDSGYPDARAFRAVVADRQGDGTEVCRQLDELSALDPPSFFFQLTDPVAERNGCS